MAYTVPVEYHKLDNGLKVVVKNRNVKLPYQDFAVFLIQEWRKIGIEAENRPLETAAWFADGQDTGNFELIIAPTVEDLRIDIILHERGATLTPLARIALRDGVAL